MKGFPCSVSTTERVPNVGYKLHLQAAVPAPERGLHASEEERKMIDIEEPSVVEITQSELDASLRKSYCLGGMNTVRQIRNIVESLKLSKEHLNDLLHKIEKEYAKQISDMIRDNSSVH